MPYGKNSLASWYAWAARAICFRLLTHRVRAAASRTFWTAGRSSPIRIAMIAITTSSSINVNPRRVRAGAAGMTTPVPEDVPADDAANDRAGPGGPPIGFPGAEPGPY